MFKIVMWCINHTKLAKTNLPQKVNKTREIFQCCIYWPLLWAICERGREERWNGQRDISSVMPRLQKKTRETTKVTMGDRVGTGRLTFAIALDVINYFPTSAKTSTLTQSLLWGGMEKKYRKHRGIFLFIKYWLLIWAIWMKFVYETNI